MCTVLAKGKVFIIATISLQGTITIYLNNFGCRTVLILFFGQSSSKEMFFMITFYQMNEQI
jgi:hypothetical protein